MCIVMYEGGCAFVQILNVTAALWVAGKKVCSCVSVCVWLEEDGCLCKCMPAKVPFLL